MMKGYAGAVAGVLAVAVFLCVAFCYFKGRRGDSRETKEILVLLLKVLIVAVVWCVDK